MFVPRLELSELKSDSRLMEGFQIKIGVRRHNQNNAKFSTSLLIPCSCQTGLRSLPTEQRALGYKVEGALNGSDGSKKKVEHKSISEDFRIF